MIRPVYQYCCDEVLPRFRDIVWSSDVAISLAAGVWLGLARDTSPVAQLGLGDVATLGVTYSTIAFGFSLAGLTIALTLPDRTFVETLARTRNAFADLLFVFSWTAVIHWCLVVLSIALLAALGSKVPLIPVGPDIERRVVLGLFGALLVYGVCQFISALLTLSQVGRLYIRELTKSPGPHKQSNV